MSSGLLPNSQPYGQMYNGGTPGAMVSVGQYVVDWLQALGGIFVLIDNAQGFTYTMPLDGTGIPVAIPQALASLLIEDRQSVIAALQGKVYPPLPVARCCP
jgi:hypothetical protein